jgi:hypothetical protein
MTNARFDKDFQDWKDAGSVGEPPCPIGYQTSQGFKVGTIPVREPEISYEDFWAESFNPADYPPDDGNPIGFAKRG